MFMNIDTKLVSSKNMSSYVILLMECFFFTPTIPGYFVIQICDLEALCYELENVHTLYNYPAG